MQKSEEVNIALPAHICNAHWAFQLVTNFEQNLSCQICMELITQPHGFVHSRVVMACH